jgi:hypothetical protein
MNLFFLHSASKDQKDHPNKHPHHGPIHDASEGSEFLDDAIHREDVQEIIIEEHNASEPTNENTPEHTKESPKN